jgi:hypothetical protein
MKRTSRKWKVRKDPLLNTIEFFNLEAEAMGQADPLKVYNYYFPLF